MEVYFPQDGVTFTEEGHYYELKGQRVPFSLTQAIKLAGFCRKPQSEAEAEAWAAKAKLGTKVHEYTYWLDQGEIELDDLKEYPDYYNRVLGWQQFREDFKFTPDLTMCEVPIAVKVNGCLFAMKLDAYGCIGDGDSICMAVVEKKTTANKEPSHAIQTAAQALAFKSHTESLNLPLKRMAVYLLEEPNSAGRCYTVEPHENRTDEKVFVALLATLQWRLNNGLLKAAI